MTLVQKFTEKYGVNPIKLVEDANLKNFGLAKTLGLQKLLEVFVEDRSLKIEVNNEFLKDLVESFAEAKEKFPENVKASVDRGTKFEVPNQMSGIPKSKGTLENFKDIVGTDDLRPIMMGVYVSEDGFIVGTDAHKLVKQKNNGLLSQFDYAGKIIDLTKYIKSKGKLIDFVDGVYPKYDAVIPRETPYEDRALSTYAFYNYAKSSLEIKRLIDSQVFNINFSLMTGSSGEMTRFSFGYHVLFDALNFAMLNGWDFFTLRYSEPNRAVVFDFDGDNIILVMPMIDGYGASSESGSTGTIPLTTEEISEKYRLGLTNQKASKPKASKPVRTSAPASSEPFKKFEGEFSDTTYIHRSQIDSIKLVSGEVLGKNDIIDGVYRVNKKMAKGGGIYSSDEMYVLKVYDLKGNLLDDSIRFRERNERRAKEHAIYYYEDDMRDKYGSDLMFTVELAKPKMAHGGGVDQDEPYSKFMYSDQDWERITKFLEKTYTPSQTDTILRSKFMRWVSGKKNFKNFVSYFNESKKYIDKMLEEEAEYAHGGMIQHGLNENDEIIKHFDNVVVVKNRTKNSSNADQIFIVNLNTGQRWTENEWYQKKPREVGKLSKMARGGSMYAGGGNMFEKPIAMYREVSGKTRNLPQSTEVYESEINRFIDYVHDFYEEEGYSKAEVKSAVNKYLADLGNQDTYGGGDSIDREKVYKYLKSDSLEKSYKSGLITQGEYEQMKSQKDKKYATGGSMSSSYEAGDTVTFKSVMGGTKTGLIVSKLGEDGFRIKTEDGFATVKKSAII